MTSSQNLPAIEPWMAAMFRPTSFADAWLLESSSRDSEVMTRALQNSLSDYPSLPLDHSVSDTLRCSVSPNSESNAISPFSGSSAAAVEATSFTPTASGSDADTLKPRGGNGGLSGKISKRKPRASKRKSQTTFIMADVANFRSMVQQVTGVKYGALSRNTNPHVQILKPEPHRLAGGGPSVVQSSGYLPTLDTSAFWLDQQGNVGPSPTASNAASDFGSGGHVGFGAQPVGVGEGDFGTFGSFPTLESWKAVM